MLNKRNIKLRTAVIISILLHILLIGVLIIGAVTRINQINAGGDGGESIDAIMVDPNAVAQQYNRQQQQRLESQRAETLRQQMANEQAQELLQKQQEEQQRLKELEKQRIEAQETARKASEEARRAKAEADRQQQLALEAKRKAEQEAKQRAEQELAEKQRIEKEKAAAEAERQKKLADDAKHAKQQETVLRDLFGGLASSSNAPSASSASGGGQRSGATGAEIDAYTSQIRNAIQNKFKDPQLYRGKTCLLRIKLAPDGLLIDVKAEGGDSALCREAISATRMANIPKPPSKHIYEKFKDAQIEFKPN